MNWDEDKAIKRNLVNKSSKKKLRRKHSIKLKNNDKAHSKKDCESKLYKIKFGLWIKNYL